MLNQEDIVGVIFVAGAILGLVTSTAVFLPTNATLFETIIRLPVIVLTTIVCGAIWSFLIATVVQDIGDLLLYAREKLPL